VIKIPLKKAEFSLLLESFKMANSLVLGLLLVYIMSQDQL